MKIQINTFQQLAQLYNFKILVNQLSFKYKQVQIQTLVFTNSKTILQHRKQITSYLLDQSRNMIKNNSQKSQNYNQNKKLSINQLMYGIQEKFSLLNHIHQQNQNKIKQQDQIKNLQILQKNNKIKIERQINLPFQQLNQKMWEIINSKPQQKINSKDYTFNSKTLRAEIAKSKQQKIDQQNKQLIQKNQLQSNFSKHHNSKIKNSQKVLPATSEKTAYKSNNRIQLTDLQTCAQQTKMALPKYYIESSSMKEIKNTNQQKNNQSYHISSLQQPAQNIHEFITQNNNSSISYHQNQSSILNESKSSSKILDKFNSIEINYLQKIKSLTFKVSFLEQRLQQTQSQKRDIMQSLETYKSLYSRKQNEINLQIQKKLEMVKQKLIEKFSEECRMKYNQYVEELKMLTNSLNEEKKKRKFLEEHNKILKMEKQNIQFMYKSFAKKQKDWLKMDIDKTKNQLADESIMRGSQNMESQYWMKQDLSNNLEEYSHIQKITQDNENLNKENIIYNKRSNSQKSKKQNKQKSFSKSRQKSNTKDKSISLSKTSQKSKSRQRSMHQNNRSTEDKNYLKSSGVKNLKKSNKKHSRNDQKQQQQMSKQQLIPFLAKGIQQLKQRLHMK